MSGRCVFSVATGQFVKGQDRLARVLDEQGERRQFWRDSLPLGSPKHQVNPYAFKAWALSAAYVLRSRPTVLLWCDSCIVPVKPLAPIWEKIECDGYMFVRNGFENYEWTADSAYPVLFPELGRQEGPMTFEAARALNRKIEHVVGGCFGISLDHKIGRQFLEEFQRLADAGAFLGPWAGGVGVQHRHDQTASSVIAWRLGMELTNAPDLFAYANQDGSLDERTVLVADGGFVHGE